MLAVTTTPIVLAHEPMFRIGPVEVRPATRELIDDGRTAILEPRVMQVLVALHKANGAVVSKDDLVAACWGGRIVGDDAINRVIGRLRNDAAEHAGNAFRIETITRVGYRLVAGNGQTVPASFGPGSRALGRRRVIIAGAAAGVVALGGGAWVLSRHEEESPLVKALTKEAYSALLDGNVDQLSNAAGKLHQAAELAPNDARIWGMLALVLAKQVQHAPAQDRTTLKLRSRAAADQALAIDPQESSAMAARIMAIPQYQNWQAWERASRAALRTQPRAFELNVLLAAVLSQVGRLKEAYPSIEFAAAAEPMGARLQVMKHIALSDLGRLDEAQSVIDHAFELWPRHYSVWFTRYYFLMSTGRARESVAMIEDKARRPIGIPDWNFDLTAMQAKAVASGDATAIRTAVAAWEEAARKGTGFAENAAMFAASMGDLDTAFRILDGYYFDRGFVVPDAYFTKEQGMYSSRRERNTFFLFSRRLEAFRRDPRFGQLTRAIGLDDYWRKSGSRPDYLA